MPKMIAHQFLNSIETKEFSFCHKNVKKNKMKAMGCMFKISYLEGFIFEPFFLLSCQ